MRPFVTELNPFTLPKKMNPNRNLSFIRTCPWFVLGIFPLLIVALRADPAATGSVVGRVQNAETGSYLYGAQIQAVTVTPGGAAAPTLLASTATDQSGSFHLDGIPAGSVSLHVLYTGLLSQDVAVVVQAGSATVTDVSLRSRSEVVQMDPFHVNVEKAMGATELAINTQRYASNLKSVVSVDDLGFIGDGSIANALKFLPGVDLEQDGFGYGNSVTLSGAPSANVPIGFGGFQMTTSAEVPGQGISAPGLQSIPQRATQLMQMSLNNISRIEVNHTTLADDPGSALAGSINFVPKSAFEHNKPSYSLTVFGAADQNKIGKSRMDGPLSSKIKTTFPGMVLSAIVPVNKRFGFSATFSTNTVPKAYVDQTESWNANYLYNQTTGVGTYRVMPLNPTHYSSDGQNLNSVLSTYQRTSVNLTGDYKLSEQGTLHASFTQAYNTMQYGARNVAWGNTNWTNPLLSTLTNQVAIDQVSLQPRVLNQSTTWVVNDANRQETLAYEGRIGPWKIDLGESYGNSRKQNRDMDVGTVFSILYNIRPLQQLNFNNIGDWGPASITAIAPNGTVLDPSNLASFVAAGNFAGQYYDPNTGALTNVPSNLPAIRYKPLWSSDHRFEGKGSASRDFAVPDFPTTVKVGFNYSSYSRRVNTDPNLGGNGQGYIYLGNRPGTDFILQGYSTPFIGNYGVGQFLDPGAIARYQLANPSLFVESRPWNDYSSAVTSSFYLREAIPAGYIRADSSALHHRLKMSYGVRFEQTRDYGTGPYFNPGGNYAKNAQGQVLNTLGGVYQTGKGQTIQLRYPVNSLAQAHANYIMNGSQSSAKYSNYFPSMALSYDVTQNIVARISGSHTLGRPDLNNIFPSLNLPDPTTLDPTATTIINANNPALRPWTSNNVALSLEYYAPDGRSNFTVRSYRRFVDNAFGTNTLTVDQTATYLTTYGINSADYPGSVLRTPINMPGRIVTSGLELSGSYLLDKLLPDWARGFRVVATGSRSTQTGGGVMAVQFAAQNLYIVPYTAGLGVSLTRSRFSVSLNSKATSKTRLQYLDYTTSSTPTYEPNEFYYRRGAIRVDMDVSFHATKNMSVFINGRDITGYEPTELRYSPNTPSIAKNYHRAIYQPVWTAGVKAEF